MPGSLDGILGGGGDEGGALLSICIYRIDRSECRLLQTYMGWIRVVLIYRYLYIYFFFISNPIKKKSCFLAHFSALGLAVGCGSAGFVYRTSTV